MSSSGVSDSETASVQVQGVSFAQGNFTATLLPPILDIAPPPPVKHVDREVVTYSKEVQTSTWVPEEDSEEESEEVVKRRVDEQVRKEMERLRLEEDKIRDEEAQQQEADKQVPGTTISRPNTVISEEEQQRILTSDTFHHFLSRSSKIVERALDEDYDVLVDYTQDVESNQ
jgi:dynein intermediate chain